MLAAELQAGVRARLTLDGGRTTNRAERDNNAPLALIIDFIEGESAPETDDNSRRARQVGSRSREQTGERSETLDCDLRCNHF
jgi:hypothetical protein